MYDQKDPRKWADDTFAGLIVNMSWANEGTAEYKGTLGEFDVCVHLFANSLDNTVVRSEYTFGAVHYWNHVLIRDRSGDVVYEYTSRRA